MEDELINDFLKRHKKCFDRFTFDKIFRFLISHDFDAEQAKDIILIHCQLSALIFQERLENGFYKKISTGEEISSDLQELMSDELRKYLQTKIEKLLNQPLHLDTKG